MNILVCIRQTFDTEEKITLKNGTIDQSDVKFIINPYDEYAIEEALRIRDEHGGQVTVVTAGPERSESALRTALAMGADKAALISDVSLPEDEYVLARLLAEFARKEAADLILGGNFDVDSGSGQVAIRAAEELDIPHIGAVTKLTAAGGRVTAERDAEGGTEVVESALPVLVTAQQGLNEPRYPSLPGIMKAKRKTIARLSAEDLGVKDAFQVKTSVVETYLPPKKEPGRILSGEPDDQVKELVEVLRPII
ncbi:electron transfer flavoprotein subunit beta/FixA family protein [Sporolactobacillus sp. KGMB 08714]|uniref:electron transfer flavoprotein subunit beta/FixA family protein n=1 Tax=Sporolactobacillus sp. KGMB 08714 TaxID=3064704 RepID=UPI002FBE336D